LIDNFDNNPFKDEKRASLVTIFTFQTPKLGLAAKFDLFA
jgi:hypothetical protein